MAEPLVTLGEGAADPPCVVVVGASAGGVEALRHLVSLLPADLPAAVLVVLHVAPSAPSALPAILARAGHLPARHVRDGDHLRTGEVLVAPPGHHLVVDGDTLRLGLGPRENGHRPAVDALFRSAARSWDGRVVSVVLSGTRDDGAAGVSSVEHNHGHCLVQDPLEALHGGMPRAAAAAAASEVLALPALAERVVTLASALARDAPPRRDPEQRPSVRETRLALLEEHDVGAEVLARPAGYGCPDCGGSLFVEDGPLRRYRCRVGHAWSVESLAAEQADELDRALGVALRSLEERASLTRELAARARERGARRSAAHFTNNADEADAAAAQVRALVRDLGSAVAAPTTEHDEDDTGAPR